MNLTKKTKVIIIAVNALLLIFIGICLYFIHLHSHTLLSQQAVRFWAGQHEGRFAQVSYFLPLDANLEERDIFAFRSTINQKLTDVGIELPETGTLWTDAYSATASLTVSSDRLTTTVTAIGVGGNFFLFHPHQLLSGSYLSDDSLMRDKVVLDYELAWGLFGSTQVEGMTVRIGGRPYYVAGVVRRETDRFSERAHSGDPIIYMHYCALRSEIEGISIMNYELVIPDPISNFAVNVVSDAFPAGLVVENSTRYNFMSIVNIFRNFGDRSVIADGLILPYWENAARISEVYIARLYALIALLAIFPLICFAFVAFILIKFIANMLKFLANLIWNAWDDRYAILETHSRRRRGLRRRRALHEGPAPEHDIRTYAEKAEDDIMLDIESIVKEILDENERG